ncbi:Rrf2 family transcriptional regulator [Rhodospirillaceae bacterium KN72]|uniref:Rrf2 family transcriptional regulator n=1 Tax=Pacificispira spongiicola TaxID=2729598 RepID=A0A7Y0E0E0_9PROT|nr:Rrf2 family transcriptional regulator [Pacificispira spongiicola]NMM44876.1 Rrf2 family transcriptional regulator [Pacificispira spongiicola]
MRLTKKLMFAIEAVLDIAYHAADLPVQSKEIADRQGIPRRYLEQVLQQLVHANILRGVRGPRGGYRLAKERRRITIAEIANVVAEMEGGRDPLTDPAGSELGHTVLRPIWQEIEEYAMQRLDQTTIEDLCVAAQRAGIESHNQNQFDFMI